MKDPQTHRAVEHFTDRNYFSRLSTILQPEPKIGERTLTASGYNACPLAICRYLVGNNRMQLTTLRGYYAAMKRLTRDEKYLKSNQQHFGFAAMIFYGGR